MTIRSPFLLTLVAACVSLFAQESANTTRRDPMLIEVLTRVVNVAGGAHALAAVHDLTELGEITFHWGEGVKGSFSIRSLGGNYFRMEADLSEGKRTWLVKDGNGSRKEGDHKALPLSSENAANLVSLTFPIAQIAAALNDTRTNVSLVGIETRDNRSIYRLRLKGGLGIASKPNPTLPVVKDLLIDALNFTIISVEDHPFRTYEPGGKLSDKPSRTVEFGEFRNVNGVLVPFSISTKLMGQPTMTIHVTSMEFNRNLTSADFKE